MHAIDKVKHTLKPLGIVFPLAACTALATVLQWSPWPFTSRRTWAILAFAFVFFCGVIGFVWKRLSQKIRTSKQKTQCRLLILLSLAIGLVLILSRSVLLPDSFLFLPQSEIEVRVISDAEQTVLLSQFDTGTTDSFGAMTQHGDWKWDKKLGLIGTHGTLRWRGAVFQAIRLVFTTSTEAGIVEVLFNGGSQTINLQTAEPGRQILTYPVPLHPFNAILIFIAYWLSLSLGMFVILFPVIQRQIAPIEFGTLPRGDTWISYALPLIVSGTLCLLTFFPGIMSPDSVDQWSQALSGYYSDWHPTIYALLMRLTMTLAQSPAILAFVQIFCLAGALGWGIASFEQIGVPRFVCWSFSLLMSVLPLNPLMSITLWKDIPFAVNMLLFFIIYLKIITSQGKWLTGTSRFIAFMLVCSGIALFRHNGLPLVILVLLISVISLPVIRKRLGLGLILTLAITGLIRGPLYGVLKVQPSGFTGGTQLLLHHISAHVAAETEFTPEERNFLDQLLPIDQWVYDPCSIDTLKVTAGLDEGRFYAEPWRGLALFWQSLRRNPLVNLRHQFAASRMIWQIPPGGSYLYRVPLFKHLDGSYGWVQANGVGLRENSKLPWLIEPIYSAYATSASEPLLDALIWRPAWMSYWALFMIALAAIRAYDRRILVLLSIPLAQFMLMLVLAFAQDMRFQYGEILIGWMSGLMLFLPVRNE